MRKLLSLATIEYLKIELTRMQEKIPMLASCPGCQRRARNYRDELKVEINRRELQCV